MKCFKCGRNLTSASCTCGFAPQKDGNQIFGRLTQTDLKELNDLIGAAPDYTARDEPPQIAQAEMNERNDVIGATSQAGIGEEASSIVQADLNVSDDLVNAAPRTVTMDELPRISQTDLDEFDDHIDTEHRTAELTEVSQIVGADSSSPESHSVETKQQQIAPRRQYREGATEEGTNSPKFLFTLLGLGACLCVVLLIATRLSPGKSDTMNLIFSEYGVGDTFYFGSYEQDNDFTNGEELIEWQILDNSDGMIVALSKYCLDVLPYNDTEEYEKVTWEHCSLRKWLNEDFYNNAFSEEEKSYIHSAYYENPNSKGLKFPGGGYTNDNVTLLSYSDIDLLWHFDTDSEISFITQTIPFTNDAGDEDEHKRVYITSDVNEQFLATYTQYALSKFNSIRAYDSWYQGVKSYYEKDEASDDAKYFHAVEEIEKAGYASWWTRTPGDSQYQVLCATSVGMLSGQSFAQVKTNGVRPVIILSNSTEKTSRQEPILGTESENDSIMKALEEGTVVEISSYEDSSNAFISTNSESVISDIERTPVFADGDGLATVFTLRNGSVVFSGLTAGKYENLNTWRDIIKAVRGDHFIIGITNSGSIKVCAAEDFNEFKDIKNLEKLSGVRDVVVGDDYVATLLDTSELVIYFQNGSQKIVEGVAGIAGSGNNCYCVYAQSEQNVTGSKSSEVGDLSTQSIVAGEDFVAFLHEDGTVAVKGTYLPQTFDGIDLGSLDIDYINQEEGTNSKLDVNLDTSAWTGIKQIVAGEGHLIGLKYDGTVVSTGLNWSGQCNVDGWKNISSIVAFQNSTVGFRENGTIAIAGEGIFSKAVGGGDNSGLISYPKRKDFKLIAIEL